MQPAVSNAPKEKVTIRISGNLLRSKHGTTTTFLSHNYRFQGALVYGDGCGGHADSEHDICDIIRLGYYVSRLLA